CSSPNGFIELLSVSEDGVAQDGGAGEYSLSDYTITWEVGGVAFADPADGTLANALGNGGTSTRIEDLDAGTYTISVTNEVTGCQTSIITEIDVVLDDVTEDPIIATIAKTEDSYCVNTGNIGDGTVEIDVTHTATILPINAANYTIEWYRGSFTLGTKPAAGDAATFIFDNQATPDGVAAIVGDVAQDPANAAADYTQLIGMADGTYTVYISKNVAAGAPNIGCESIATITIGDNPATLTIDPAIDLDFANNFNCSSPNGFIELLSVSEDGVAQDGGAGEYSLSDYTITWEVGGVAFADPA
ncbi:MAG: hypothetical protein GY821_14160, partial [Gammaproteobacteria bacterium]|nr:hypothetical protein [Gammaproteobacteria bacterium]